MTNLIEDARTSLLEVWADLLNTPHNAYRARKIIHDPIWGTTRYEPWEAALLDLGIFQRLRGLKQTGFAHFTYPAAEHSRFQHTLGVMHAASKIFDSISSRRDEDGVSTRGKEDGFHQSPILCDDYVRYRRLLRLAALVHDLGHSFYSHASERIFGLIDPFPQLTEELTPTGEKAPGAAEAVVYLLVTSSAWKDRVARVWEDVAVDVDPPTDADWEMIGRWVMGQEPDPHRQFLADIISGPLDADKLDYISRDAYFAGVPVGYDLERYTATVCVDPQNNRYRLTIPAKGINALEQLIMGRLVLNSYLYHHQKVRAAEAYFERLLVREYFERGTTMGVKPPWQLFAMQDADIYCLCSDGSDELTQYQDLIGRRLPVRIAEIRGGLLEGIESESVSSEFTGLLSYSAVQDLETYRKLVMLEDDLASSAGCPPGSIIVDFPKPPSYTELEDLQLPDDATGEPVDPGNILQYTQWINAYSAFRPFVRVFTSRQFASDDQVCKKVLAWFKSKGLALPGNVCRSH